MHQFWHLTSRLCHHNAWCRSQVLFIFFNWVTRVRSVTEPLEGHTNHPQSPNMDYKKKAVEGEPVNVLQLEWFKRCPFLIQIYVYGVWLE